jgi:hypothetical protein
MKTRYWLVVFACALLSCQAKIHAVYSDEEKSKASLALTKFHHQFNAGSFEQIYYGSDERLQKQVPKDGFVRSFREAHEKFGDS